MPATRTQVYLTQQQRRALDARAAREGKTMAQIVREAVDAYLAGDTPNDAAVNAALERTFGACPELDVPDRSEWDRSDRWPGW